MSGLSLTVHNLVVGGKPGPRIIDISKFIDAVLSAFENWMNAGKGSEPFDTHYAHCIQKHPDGLKPYVDGVPFIF